MKTTVERIKPTRVKLLIEVSPAAFKPSLDHAYEHIGEQVNVPGFRKGKIPKAILEQRVGRPAILEHAIGDGLDKIYRTAVEAEKLRPIGQPNAEVKSTPDPQTFEGNLVVEIEVEVRPEIKLPEYKGLKVTVDEIKVGGIEVEAELDRLRGRFGALKSVDRPAKRGDFTTIDLKATIGGNEVDSAQNISYEIGSNNLLDGIDEALDTLTAGETTTFKSKLVGGEQAGQEAEVTVTLTAVKEREMPAADDAFAQMASEFDTVADLKKSIEEQLGRSKVYDQVLQARQLLTDQLIEAAKVPVSDEIVEAEVNRHLEGEGRLQDAEHRAEVTIDSTKGFQTQVVLDEIAEKEEIRVSEQELIQHLIQSSQQYGMEPQEFVNLVQENGQIPVFVQEVTRRKALSVVLENAVVTDKKGKPVDVSEFNDASAAVSGAGADDHEGHNH